MSDSVFDRFDPYHQAYLTLPPFRAGNNIRDLFDALSVIDATERKWITESAAMCLGCESTFDPNASDELNSDREMEEMRAKSYKLIRSGVSDCFLTYSLVVFICNDLHYKGAQEYEEEVVSKMKLAAEFFQGWADSGQVPQEIAGMGASQAEERINNIAGETALFRKRYDLFCQSVVRRLVHNSSADSNKKHRRLDDSKEELDQPDISKEESGPEWTLLEAAFLWHGLEPPDTTANSGSLNRDVEETNDMLEVAVHQGELDVNREVYSAQGCTSWVTRAALIRFARVRGDFPKFLFPEKR